MIRAASSGGDRPPCRATLLTRDRIRAAALVWSALWPLLLAVHLIGQRRVGWTDGVDRPFGEDFLNFWSAARLALTGRAAAIYDIPAFHAFQQAVVGHAIDLYHYSYPPTLLVLTVPFALLPYPLAWFAWQAGGWLLFATALRRVAPDGWLLVAVAWPAVFVNAMGGQIGAWIAGVAGWGLILLPRRAVVAGLLLSLLTIKPQLAWLVPLALLAGREWRALGGFVAGALALAIASLAVDGWALWAAYASQAALLKRVILEDGWGVWHRMISAFVLVRHAGASPSLAYAAQALVSIAVAALVLAGWRRHAPLRGPLLLVGMLAGAIYVSDYDGVLLALAAAPLWPQAGPRGRLAIALAAIAPLVAAPIAAATGLALGTLMLWPLLALAARGGTRLNTCAARR